MIWQPLTEDVGMLDLHLSAWVRVLVAAHPAGGPQTPNWQAVSLGDGRTAQFRLAVAPQIRTKHGVRAVITYNVTGQVVSGADGLSCAGEAVLDLKTRAFLEVRCALTPLGTVLDI